MAEPANYQSQDSSAEPSTLPMASRRMGRDMTTSSGEPLKRRELRSITAISNLSAQQALRQAFQSEGSDEISGAKAGERAGSREAPKPERLLKGDPNAFTRISKVSGVIMWARGLPNTDTWGKSDPYCVVKGIRSNNHLVDMFCTKVIDNSLSPEWYEGFQFSCPDNWGLVELVGLKFLLYDTDDGLASFMGSDDFLGGADLDLSMVQENRRIERKLELAGSEAQQNSKKRVKSLLCVQITVQRELAKKPLPPNDALSLSMVSFQRLVDLRVNIVKARNLKNTDTVGKSDPYCSVRLVMMSGAVREICRTGTLSNTLNPTWDEEFDWETDWEDEPVMIVFDVFDADPHKDGRDEEESDDHVGSALFPVSELVHGVSEKKKLMLLGESQLLELRLLSDGKPGNVMMTSGGMQKASATTDAQQRGRGLGLMTRFNRLRMKQPKGRSWLYVQIEAGKQTEEMPHLDIYQQPREIREEEDIEDIVEMPDWTRSIFSIPTQIDQEMKRMKQGMRPNHGTLTGVDRIVFVCGMVRGASGLVSADFLGKSDPYCIVEGVSHTGERVFIHRTRYLKDILCPVWNESFHYVVPIEEQVHKLLFSVYDDDQEDASSIFEALEHEGDDFLGRTTLDLSYLKNGDRICEDMPLTGTKLGKKKRDRGGPQASFRKNASISVEVRCERRVCPVYERSDDRVDDHEGLQTHVLSRSRLDGGRKFVDPSQQDLWHPPHHSVAAKVFPLWWGCQLAEGQKKRETDDYRMWFEHKETDKGWYETRDGYQGPEIVPIAGAADHPRAVNTRTYENLGPPAGRLTGIFEDLEPDQVDELLRKQEQETRSLDRVGKSRPMPRTSSLPELATRFTKTEVNMRQFARAPELLANMRFRDSEAAEPGRRASLGRSASKSGYGQAVTQPFGGYNSHSEGAAIPFKTKPRPLLGRTAVAHEALPVSVM